MFVLSLRLDKVKLIYGKNILCTVFFDEENHWDNFVKKYGQRIRIVVQSEVDKFCHCGDIVKGLMDESLKCLKYLAKKIRFFKGKKR